MTYCTQQNMIDRFGNDELAELTDRQQLGEIDTAVLDAAIADATADIDMYLAVRYTLPLGVVPGFLTRLSCDIARYYLYDGSAPERVKDANDAAMKLLHSIARGEIDLNVGEASAGAGDVVLYENDSRVFDESQDWP